MPAHANRPARFTTPRPRLLAAAAAVCLALIVVPLSPMQIEVFAAALLLVGVGSLVGSLRGIGAAGALTGSGATAIATCGLLVAAVRVELVSSSMQPLGFMLMAALVFVAGAASVHSGLARRRSATC